MKLLKQDGSPVLIGKKTPIVIGVRKGKMAKVSEIIEPTPENPDGYVICNREMYYPNVIGAHWEDDTHPQADALPVPKQPGNDPPKPESVTTPEIKDQEPKLPNYGEVNVGVKIA